MYQRERRKLPIGKDLKMSTEHEPVFTWAFKSSQPRGGQIINYVTQLNTDGTLSCNCPGWVFARKGQERACKHTKLVVDEAPGIFKKWKKGEALPLMEADAETQQALDRVLSKKGKAPKTTQAIQDNSGSSAIKAGRFVCLD